MAKKRKAPPPAPQCVKQSAVLQEILDDLHSPDEVCRAEAVRKLCPCRTAFDVPVQRYIAAMRDDPSSSVRHEVHHVLDEDSRWGKKLEMRRLRGEMEKEPDEGDSLGPFSLGWRSKRKPLRRRLHYPQRRDLHHLLGDRSRSTG